MAIMTIACRKLTSSAYRHIMSAGKAWVTATQVNLAFEVSTLQWYYMHINTSVGEHTSGALTLFMLIPRMLIGGFIK